MEVNPTTPTASETFDRLRNSYLLALGLIALAVIAEQWLVNSFLQDQRKDAEVINIAGRQRMLSQRIVKLAALGKGDPEEVQLAWLDRHEWLKKQLLNEPVYQGLARLDPLMINLLDGRLARTDSLSEIFLLAMDDIVNQVTATAEEKVIDLQRTKMWLGLATLVILLLELMFIFTPIARFVARQFGELKREREAQDEARSAAERAVSQREASLRELHALNEAIDEAVLFATLKRDGSPIHVSNQLSKLIGWREDVTGLSLVENLHPTEASRDYFAEVISNARAGSWKGEWSIIAADGSERWLSVTIVPARQAGSQTEVFLLASDITLRKADQLALDVVNRERVEEEVERSKLRSRQIVDAQEKERLRIARDLHDGIGQKLTALKFSLEALRVSPDDANHLKINRLRDLAGEIIHSIRVATFNLSPPELADYGLNAGLEKLCKELSRLTGQRIIFESNGFDARFDATREVNIYRIIQEAINNAIKYAEANYILVAISPGDSLFSITISDDGEGFDTDEVNEGSEEGSGFGLTNMISRVEDMNGRLFVYSHPETGTKVTINLPLPGED